MKKFSIEIKWGVIFFVATLLWMVLERIAGLHSTNIARHAIFTNLFAIVAIVIYVLALLDKRKSFYQGKMSWKEGFISGLIIAVVVAILSPLGQLITHYLITPDYLNNAIQYAVSEGKLTQDAAEAYFSIKSYIIQSVMGALFMGAVTSAIVAFFVKKS